MVLIAYLFVIRSAHAQNFYSSSEVTLEWKYWTDDNSWDYLIQNGKPVTISCAPRLDSESISLTYPTEIIATYIRANKFLVISFSNNLGIRLREGYSAKSFERLNTIMSYVQEQSWFEIDFEHIVYEPSFDRIMIPCGIDYNGLHNALCIDFITSTAVKSMTQDSSNSEIRYYDMTGKCVELDDVKGQIVIQTNGNTSVKFLNR